MVKRINSRQKGTAEEWRNCFGVWADRYQVSSLGRVRNIATGKGRVPFKVLKVSKGSKGYLQVSLYRGCNGSTVKVHRLVALAFLGERPEGYSVDHINGIKTDNTLPNLEYVTFAENNRRAKAKGLLRGAWSRGGKPKGKKITYPMAIEIRAKASNGVPRKQLAKCYGIHIMTVGEIIREEIWKEALHG